MKIKLILFVMMLLGIVENNYAKAVMDNRFIFPDTLSYKTNGDTTYYVQGDSTICQGDSTLINISSNKNFSSGTKFYLYSNGTITDSSFSITNPAFYIKVDGAYYIQVISGADTTILPNFNVHVKLKPIAGFNFSPSNNICSGSLVYFIKNSQINGGSNISSYNWNFGDGNTSTQEEPTHSFTSSVGNGTDSFSVKLKVTNTDGCTDSIIKKVPINQRPDAKLNGTGATTINGQTYFHICGTIPSILSFTNKSSSTSTNSTYKIIWGDGSADTTFYSFTGTISHLFPLGYTQMTYVVQGNNGCTDTTKYNVFVGNGAQGTITNSISTSVCANTPYKYVLINAASNPVGTQFILSYSDGTTETLTAPVSNSDTLSHIFQTTSCGRNVNISGQTLYNTYSVSLTIPNPCGSVNITITPIHISEHPISGFSVNTDTTCVNTPLTITNTSSKYGIDVDANGNCTYGKTIWKIRQGIEGTDYVIASGNLGNDNSSSDVSLWNPGSSSLTVKFNTPGKYIITQIIATGNSNCGIDSVQHEICVNPIPTSNITLDTAWGCTPSFIVNASGTTNATTCSQNSFLWSINNYTSSGCLPNTSLYGFTNGTDSTSQNPQITFNNPGTYTLRLRVTSPANACYKDSLRTIIVKKKPSININNITSPICAGTSVSPTASIANCGATTENIDWEFSTGTPASSTLANPGAIMFNTSGIQTISLKVTNECGDTTATKSVTVNPLPNLIITDPLPVCSPTKIDLTAPSITTGSTTGLTLTYWKDTNATVVLSSPSTVAVTGTYYIKGTNTFGCSVILPVHVIVNSLPSVIVTNPSVVCSPTKIDLTAPSVTTGSTAGLTYTYWINSSATLSLSSPSTVTTTGTYYIKGTDANGCYQVKPVTATINSAPSVIITDPAAVCYPTKVNLTTSSVTAGSTTGLTYSYWMDTTATISLSSSNAVATSGTYFIKGTNLSTGCATIKPVHVTVNPLPTVTVTNPTAVCSPATIDLTTSSVTAGSTAGLTFTYWTNSGTTASLSSPSAVTISGTYYIKGTDANTCSVTQPVSVTINPLPVLKIIHDTSICNGNTISIGGSSTAGHNYGWESNPAGFISALSNPSVSPNITTTYTLNDTISATSCFDSRSVTVTVNPTPVISDTASTNPTTCGGTEGTITLKGLTASTSYNVIYTFNSSPVTKTLSSNSSGDIIITGLTKGTYSNIYVVLGSCNSNVISSIVLNDPSAPDVPTITTNSPLCSGSTINLSASSTTAGVSYRWTGPNGYTGNTSDVNIPNVTTANQGTYTVTVMLNNCTSTANTSVVVNQTPSAPVVNDVTYCQGVTTTALTAQKSSNNNTLNWYTVATGGTSSITAPTPSSATVGTTTYYVSQTTTAVCEGPRAAITVTVNPTPVISDTASTNPTTCGGTDGTITLKGLTANTSYSVSYSYGGSTQTISITSDGSGNIILSGLKAGIYSNVIVTEGSCPSSPALSFTLSDPSAPDVPTITTNSPLCSGSTINLSASSTTTGVSYSWTGPNNFTSNQQDTTISNAGTSASGTYKVTVTLNNCSSSATKDVAVNPLPVAFYVNANSTICSNASTNVSLSSNPGSNTSFMWTIVDSTNVSGAASDSGKNSIVQNLINNSKTVQRVVYGITPIYTSYGLSCYGTAKNDTLIINPIPSVTNIPGDSICSFTSTNIHLTSDVAGTNFNWTATGNSNISGYSNGAGLIINQTLINSSTATQAIVYHVTPVLSNNSVQCSGTGFDYTVNVLPSPAVNFSIANQTICSGGTSTAVNLTSLSSSVNFSWNATILSGITGIINSGTDNIPSQTLINSTNLPIDINYKAQANTSTNSCLGNIATYTITVNPTPVVSITNANDSICSNTNADISLTTNTGSGTNISWIVIGNANITGASPGTGTHIVQKLINSGTADEYIVYSITPSFTNNGITCTGTTVNDTIVVHPIPKLSGNLTQSAICSNQLFTYMPNSATPNTSFVWSRNTISGISNAAVSNTNGSINETIINTTYSPVTVNYNYVLTANGCSNNQTVSVIVNPNAKASYTADTLVSCAPYKLINHITLQNYPNANDGTNYKWYANNNLIGTGTAVPNYTITQTADTVILKLTALSKWGCVNDTTQKTIYTIQVPIPRFIKDKDTACGPVTINFTNTTLPLNAINSTRYVWNFGNGITSTTTQPTPVTFNSNPNFKDTTYYITLSAVTSCDSLVYKDSVHIKPGAKALFTPSSTLGCAPFKVNFRNNSLGANSAGNGMTYYWDYGDGTLDTTYDLSTREHIYYNNSQQVDTFYVRLKALNNCSIDSISYILVIYPNTVKPALIVNGNEKNGCAPMTVHFYNNSTGANRFVYDFKDGTTLSTTKSYDTVLHTFYNAGTYIVSMNATNGCSDTTVVDTITVYPAVTSPSFIVNPVACFGDSVYVENLTDTTLMNSFIWNFGDGSSSNNFEPRHLYNKSDTYQITVTAYKTYSTGVSCSASASQTVQVTASPVAFFTSNSSSLNCTPFTYTVSTTPGSLASAEWTFSDVYSLDTTAVGFSASHVFNKAGTFKVKLKVYNASGCSDSTIQYVTVTESPIANFVYDDSVICSRNGTSKTITFNNTTTYSGNKVVTYQWYVDNVLKNSGTNKNDFTYTFSSAASDALPKTFSVLLKTTASNGCTIAKTATVSFVQYPVASFVLSSNQGCDNSVIQASDTASSYAHSRLWSWSSSITGAPALTLNSDTSRNILIHLPTNNTNAVINYAIKLMVANTASCSDSIIKNISLYPKPQAAFVMSDTVCSNVNYTVQNNSVANNGEQMNTLNFEWYIKKYNFYGDTSIVAYYTDLNPQISFTNTGTKDSVYFIQLKVTTSHGCMDSLMKKVVVHPSTVALFTSSPSISCTPMTLYVFSNTSKNASSYSWYINNQIYSNDYLPDDTVLIKSGTRYSLKLVANSSYGCLADSSITYITTYKSPTAKLKVSDTVSCTGSLTEHFFDLSTAYGTTLTSWNWNFGDGTYSTLQNPVHDYTIAGTYNVTLTVQDARGCNGDSVTAVNVTVYGKPTAAFYASNVCFGDSVIFVNKSNLGKGSSQFSNVIWNFGDGNLSNTFSPAHLYNGAGNYTVTLVVYSNNSCVADTVIKTVTVYGKPKAAFSWDKECINTSITFTNLSEKGLGETSFGNIIWNFGNGNGPDSSLSFNPTVTFTKTGEYLVKLVVHDAICVRLTDTVSKTVKISAPRAAIIYPRLEAIYGSPLQLSAYDGGVSYDWAPSTGLTSTIIQNPVALYTSTDPNDITYKILIIDSAGCQITDTQEVFIFRKAQILGPSAFLPNGTDPLNRRFLPHYININRLLYLNIYNRWGNEVFSTSNMSTSWDGTDKNGNQLPMATYIWIAEGIDDNGNHVMGKGNVSLIRN